MVKTYEQVKKSQSGNGVMVKDLISKKLYWVPRAGCIVTGKSESGANLIQVEDWVKKPYMPAKPPAPDFYDVPKEQIKILGESEKALNVEFEGQSYWFAKSHITDGGEVWKITGWAWEKKKPMGEDDGETVNFEATVLKESDKGINLKLTATGEEAWFAKSQITVEEDGSYTMPVWAYEKRNAVVRP
jgi:hypothetical protein